MKIDCRRGGYKQIPISAGKREDLTPKKIDVSCTLVAGLSHGTMGQYQTYVMVIENDTNAKESETR